MKKLLSLLLILIFATSLTWGAAKEKTPKAPKPKKEKAAKKEKATAVSSTAVGYKVDGDKIIFMYNPKDYPAGFYEIEEVNVAGEFNGWDAHAKDWEAVLNAKDGVYYFESTKDKVPSGTKFKFTTNGAEWQQPDDKKVPKENLTDDGFGGFNLVVIY